MIDVNSEQGQVLIGTLFGDACLRNEWSNTTNLRLKHSITQKEYLEWKIRLLNINGLHAREYTEKGYEKCYAVSPNLEALTPFYEDFYPNGTKRVPRNSGKKRLPKNRLEQLGPLGLAVWYCDDGSYCYWYKKTYISTQSFTKPEHELMKDWFKERWGINCIIEIIDRRPEGYKIYYRLVIPSRYTTTLLELIKPYVEGIECMRYKLGHLLKENHEKLELYQERKRIARRKNREMVDNEMSKKNTRWSEDETNFLRNNYEKLTDRQIAQLLERPLSAISNKRMLLGLIKGGF